MLKDEFNNFSICKVKPLAARTIRRLDVSHTH